MHEGVAVGLLVLGLAACSRQAEPPAPLTIARTSPALDDAAAPLLLNDSITVYFSDAIQPVSVTTDSVTLVDEAGRQVPGILRASANWVTFEPLPPFARTLDDGSYLPGASYRLLVAGSPRPDAVRALDGRRLATPAAFPVRIARLDERPQGLPAPLRPLGNELPFFLRPADELERQLPANEPRIYLQFTQPLLPPSVVPEAFRITLIAQPPVELRPRRVRIVPTRFDPIGTTVEIDLGAIPVRVDGVTLPQLAPGGIVSVALGRGADSVLDYTGAPPIPSPAQLWSVVAGSSVALVQWPSGGDALHDDAELSPGFEVRSNGLRPRIRVECGDGSLGVFRPRADVVLRPGQPFDRGDGEVVVSRGDRFPFLAIDVPAGVRVRVESGASPVQLLACGSVHIAGELELVAVAAPVPPRQLQHPVAELAAAVPVALVAAGPITVEGRIATNAPPVDGRTTLLLASAATIDLRGPIPFQTLLAVEANDEATAMAIRGARGQSIVFDPTFTYGPAPGAEFVVRALTPWRALPIDRDSGRAHLVEPSPELKVAWQVAPADPARDHQPDLTLGRVGRLQPLRDGDTIAFPAGSFVRFELSAAVRAGQPLPRLQELRLTDR
ncbi:MAG: Ig-like domain-containing protein [Planctomycetes bacterium]|nr:Ig-like domain-containing protein [Planctomycetota bacterium]